MYGVQINESGMRHARTMMRLRRAKSDAATGKPGRQAFSDFVAPLSGGAGLQARRLVQVASMPIIQWCGTSQQHLRLNKAIKTDARTSRGLWQR